MEEDITSLTHTKWRCQYHLVFAPKYRRKIIYGKYKLAIGKILRRIIERIEGAEIIEANACEDHIHMLVTIPPKMSVSKFMGILKGKSSFWQTFFLRVRQIGCHRKTAHRERPPSENEYWMMGTKPLSFDSRCWGPIHADQVVARAYPLF